MQKILELSVRKLRDLVKNDLFSVVASGAGNDAQIAELGQMLAKMGIFETTEPTREQIMQAVYTATKRAYDEFYRP